MGDYPPVLEVGDLSPCPPPLLRRLCLQRTTSPTSDHVTLSSRRTLPLIGQYQIMLLGDRDTCMRMTCTPWWVAGRNRGVKSATCWSQVHRPNHYATAMVRQWLCGRAPDLQSGGCGRLFESRPELLRIKVYSAFHPSGVRKWVPAAAGKAKAGMAHSDCGWTCGCAGKTVKSLERAYVPYLSASAVVIHYTKRRYIKCM